MRIPESKIDEVAAAADIVQIISEYVDLKKAGKDYRGLCPFHGDKDPSFYVSPSKGIFHCFGCAVGGSVFSFLMKIESLSFVEAVRKVAARCGISFEFQAGSGGGPDERKVLEEALGFARGFFSDNLATAAHCLDYLKNRRIPHDRIIELGLGFAPDSWEALTGRLRRSGISDRVAVSAGLIRRRENGPGHYDYFRSRVMIPIHNLSGSSVAFGGRILGDGEPKYLNSPESAVFQKKRTLFGLDSARNSIREEGSALLVEGYFDQISLRINGIENVVAPLGTSLGSEHVRLIKRFTDRLIMIFDADEAGLRAVKRSIPICLANGIEPECLILPGDKDPDEAINRIGPDAFRELVDTALPAIDFFLENLEKQYDMRSLHGRNLALQESLPVLREIADSKEGDYLIERFSARIRVREDRIRSALRQSGRIRSRNKGQRIEKGRTLFDFPADERIIVRGMLLTDGFIDRVIESGVLKDLKDPVLVELARMMVDYKSDSGHFDANSFSNSVQDQDLAGTVAAWLHPKPAEDDIPCDEDGARLLEETLQRMRLRRLEKRRAEIQDRIRSCGEEEYTDLLIEFNEINRRLHKSVRSA